MVKKKFFRQYLEIKSVIGIHIAWCLGVPILAVLQSLLIHGDEIDLGVEGAVKSAIMSGFRWGGIIVVVFTVVAVIRFFCKSGTINFTDTGIQLSSWIFSENVREIPYDAITQIVFSDGLWIHQGKDIRGKLIHFCNENGYVFNAEIYPELCLKVLSIFPETYFWIIDGDCQPCRIDDYLKIDFASLSYDQQFAIMKYYSEYNGIKYRSGEEILRKKKKL